MSNRRKHIYLSMKGTCSGDPSRQINPEQVQLLNQLQDRHTTIYILDGPDERVKSLRAWRAALLWAGVTTKIGRGRVPHQWWSSTATRSCLSARDTIHAIQHHLVGFKAAKSWVLLTEASLGDSHVVTVPHGSGITQETINAIYRKFGEQA